MTAHTFGSRMVAQAMGGHRSNWQKRPPPHSKKMRYATFLMLLAGTERHLGAHLAAWWRTENESLDWLRPVDAFYQGCSPEVIVDASGRADLGSLYTGRASLGHVRLDAAIVVNDRDTSLVDAWSLVRRLLRLGCHQIVMRRHRLRDAEQVWHLSVSLSRSELEELAADTMFTVVQEQLGLAMASFMSMRGGMLPRSALAEPLLVTATSPSLLLVRLV